MLNKKQIKMLENLLDERHAIAVKTDIEMGNTEGLAFLPNNGDYIYYSAILDVCEALGYVAQGKMINGKAKHLLF